MALTSFVQTAVIRNLNYARDLLKFKTMSASNTGKVNQPRYLVVLLLVLTSTCPDTLTKTTHIQLYLFT